MQNRREGLNPGFCLLICQRDGWELWGGGGSLSILASLSQPAGRQAQNVTTARNYHHLLRTLPTLPDHHDNKTGRS